jgi:mRNA interferase RelE/StbE
MAYQVIFKPRPKRELDKLPSPAAERIARAIDALSIEPRPRGCIKMAGPDGFWRIRVGDYRVVYQIHDNQLIILVVRIGHRREVYD